MLHSRNGRWAYRTRSRPYKLQKHPSNSDDPSLLDILNRNFFARMPPLVLLWMWRRPQLVVFCWRKAPFLCDKLY